MRPDAEVLYSKIVRIESKNKFDGIGTSLFFATPADLLIGDTEEQFICFCAENGAPDYEKMSDYERFSSFVANIPSFRGSGVLEAFCEKVRIAFDHDILLSDLDAPSLWKKYSDSLSERGGYLPLSAPPSDMLCLPLLCKASDYGSWVESQVALVEKSERVMFDISNTKFIRSDAYHCSKAYDEYLKVGGKLPDILSCGLLYSVCDNLKKRNICLWLNVGENIASARDIMNYLAERGVLPNVRIFTYGKHLQYAVPALCKDMVSGDKKIKVLFGMLMNKGLSSDMIAQDIKNIAGIYPIGQLSFGGLYPYDINSRAYENIFKRGLCKALCDICPTLDEAEKTALKILGSKE